MAFWKESGDPWDRKPGKNWLEEKEPKENPIDSLKQWNEDRKTERARKAAERTPAPIPCPWCGKPMETGYLDSGKGIWWAPGIPNFLGKWVGMSMVEGAVRIDEGVFGHITSWRCQDCGKMVFDIPEPPADPWTTRQQTADEETKEEEQSEE